MFQKSFKITLNEKSLFLNNVPTLSLREEADRQYVLG